MHLFRRSYPDFNLSTVELFLPTVVLEVAICYLGQVKR